MLAVRVPVWVHTCAGSVDYHVHVDVHPTPQPGIDTELVIGPAPDILCEIIQDKENGNEKNKKSEETAGF